MGLLRVVGVGLAIKGASRRRSAARAHAFARELRRSQPKDTDTEFCVWPPVNDDER
jgi:hypothetical protein